MVGRLLYAFQTFENLKPLKSHNKDITERQPLSG